MGKGAEGLACRQSRHPIPLAQLTRDNIHAAANAMIAKLIRMRNSRQTAAFVFIDSNRRLYVMSEDAGNALQWRTEHKDWFRGIFKAGCDYDGIVEELGFF